MKRSGECLEFTDFWRCNCLLWGVWQSFHKERISLNSFLERSWICEWASPSPLWFLINCWLFSSSDCVHPGEAKERPVRPASWLRARPGLSDCRRASSFPHLAARGPASAWRLAQCGGAAAHLLQPGEGTRRHLHLHRGHQPGGQHQGLRGGRRPVWVEHVRGGMSTSEQIKARVLSGCFSVFSPWRTFWNKNCWLSVS